MKILDSTNKNEHMTHKYKSCLYRPESALHRRKIRNKIPNNINIASFAEE